jgi:hypothetical protein
MPNAVRNSAHEPVTKLCLTLDVDRRNPEGRIRSEREFREHFFPYDAESATDRIFKFLPNEVRGPIVSSWGIRGKRTALADDDARVTSVVHDALLADDIDDTLFEQGLLPEILVTWCDLRDWWSFWRRGVHTKHSIGLALRTAYDLGLFDAKWFLEVLENGSMRGTDVLVEGLSKAELGRWIRRVHESGDGSPKGLVAALGWTSLVDHTADKVLLRIIDAFALMRGLAEAPAETPSWTPQVEPPVEVAPPPPSVPSAEPSSVRPRPAVAQAVAARPAPMPVRKPTPAKTKLG